MNVLMLGDAEGLRRQLLPGQEQQLQITQLRSGGCTGAQIAAACPDAEVLVAEPNNRLDAQLIASLPKLKLIHGVGVGYNLFDLETAKQAGIPVCNCRGSNARAVAEHAVMLMLCCLRQVKLNDTLVAEGRQDEQQKHCIATGCIRELGDCTVGLVGFGAIARTVAQMLVPFGPKVLYYDPFRADRATEEACHAEYADLETIQKCSDILSLHLAVTPQTMNMVDADFLAGMKDGASIINTARGDLVDSAALAEALCSGKIAGAGLDTIAPEPVTQENPLLCLPHNVAENVIYSPHIAGITGTSGRRNYRMIAAAIRAVQNGQHPENIVNGL